MEKTKMGIGIGLMSAIIYWSGFGGILTTTVLVVAVLMLETNENLRTNALQGLLIVIGFTALRSILGIFNFPYEFSKWFYGIYDVIRYFIYVYAGFNVLDGKVFHLNGLSGWVEKHQK